MESNLLMTPEELAQAFHESYERQAPNFGYKTREASAKPWADVPEQNKSLMIAVAAEVLTTMRIKFADYLRKTGDRFQIDANERHILNLVANDAEAGK